MRVGDLLLTFAGWINRQQQDTFEYLVEESRGFKEPSMAERSD